ncbi:MAG: NAD-dependent epimerase/dehydratase family protein [Candidatus Hodarchaeota archaeon]
MDCLVTGGAGFLGSHLIEELIANNHNVVCLDDFSTGKRRNLKVVEKHIKLIEGDIRNPEIVEKAINDVDYVFHLAAQISVNRSVREPAYDASVNIEGIINLLEASCISSVKRFVYVSTGGAIYGEPLHLPVSESTAEEPISPYGLSKLVGEKYLQLFHRIHNLSYSIIRPANIYGPRQDPLGEAGVISIFLGNLKKRLPLEIFGDGTDTRDYIYVKDIADICIKAINSSVIDIFNAGTGKQTNLLELINIIEKVTNISAHKKFSNPRPGDVKNIALESIKAKKYLNWSPKTELEFGIQKTWEWFNSSE